MENGRPSLREAIKKLVDTSVRYLPDSVAIRLLNALRQRYRIGEVVIDTKGSLIEGTIDDFGLFRPLMVTGTYKGEGGADLIEEMMQLRPHGTYIDIGANVGMTTIPFARRYGWDFYAFEPEPIIFRRLRCNLVRNGVDQRVQLFNVALSNAHGSAVLKRAHGNHGDNWLSIGLDNYKHDTWEDVPIKTDMLDNVFAGKKLADPIVVKIDTQGSEPLVVAGGHEILSRAKLIALEFWPRRMKQMGTDPLAFYDEITAQFPTVIGTEIDNANIYSGRSSIRQRIIEIIKAGSGDYFDIILSREDDNE